MPEELIDFSAAKHYWLMKTEPSECSFESVYQSTSKTVSWFGIRNYQARNFIRDRMAIGDGVLFYHSSCPKPGIVGLAKIASKPYPDAFQFDATSDYFDPKSTVDAPRWLAIDVMALAPSPLITLDDLRKEEKLVDMPVLKRGNRLSITPVTPTEFNHILSTFIGHL